MTRTPHGDPHADPTPAAGGEGKVVSTRTDEGAHAENDPASRLGVGDHEGLECTPGIVVIGGAQLFDPLEREFGSGYSITWAPHEQAQGPVLPDKIDVAVIEVGPFEPRTGALPLELALKLIRSVGQQLEFVFTLDRASLEPLLRANRSSSLDFVVKPATPDELSFRVHNALARVAARRWAGHLEAALESLRLAARARVLPPTTSPPGLAQVDYREAMRLAHEHAARDYLGSLMRGVNGNVARAAKHAGLERESLHRLLRRYGIRSNRGKPG